MVRVSCAVARVVQVINKLRSDKIFFFICLYIYTNILWRMFKQLLKNVNIDNQLIMAGFTLHATFKAAPACVALLSTTMK